jgi:DNA replication protein DnaC
MTTKSFQEILDEIGELVKPEQEHRLDCACKGTGETPKSEEDKKVFDSMNGFGADVPWRDFNACSCMSDEYKKYLENCEKTQMIKSRLNRMKLPPRYLSYGLSSYIFPTEATKKIINDYVEMGILQVSGKKKKSLYLQGKPNSGKTHLAISVATSQAIDKNKMWKYCGVHELFLKIKGTFDKDSGSENEESILMGICETSFLILDDLIPDKISDWAREKLWTIIDYRWKYDLATMFTAEQSIGEIDEILGSKISTRLAEMSAVISLDNKHGKRI